MKSIETLIQEQSEVYLNKIKSKLPRLKSEEDLRIEVVKHIDSFCEMCNLDFDGSHEVPMGKGRIDSVYRFVFFEFKKPKKLSKNVKAAGVKELQKQISERFSILAKQQKETKIKRYFAIGTDGHFFIFAKYRDGNVEFNRPIPLSRFAIETVLRKISACGNKGKALTSENLATEFSYNNPGVSAAIKAFYQIVRENKHPKTRTFVQQWMLHFSEVCGYDIENPGDEIKDLCKELTGSIKQPELILFALHSYYSIFIKLLAAEVLYYLRDQGSFITHDLSESSQELKRRLSDLERGGVFKQIGIGNLLEGDLFSWYIDDWSSEIYGAIKSMAQKLENYDVSSIGVDFSATNDLLKDLYEKMIPKSIRHSSGEYYTPDWLAKHLIDKTGYTGKKGLRFLDPSCGSGTFIVQAINEKIKHAYENGIDLKIEDITNNVVGFDLNPIAVISARVNYLISIFPLLKQSNKVIELPIYLTDSILTPCFKEMQELTHLLRFQTAAGDFLIPKEIIKQNAMPAFCEFLEDAVKSKLDLKTYWSILLKKHNVSEKYEAEYADLFKKLIKLDEEKRNGIWARIIKNMFAPVINGKFDFVCGNPPWVRWSYLPSAYRDATKHVWADYGLFSLNTQQVQLSGGEKDISQLFAYVCIDHYLSDSGVLGFLITQSVFRAKGQADGFRRFRLGEREYFKLREIHDLVEVKPFDGVGNKTTFFIAEKGKKTTYPVPYYRWDKIVKGKLNVELSLDSVLERVEIKKLEAQPGGEKETSFLQVSDPKRSRFLKKLHGTCNYKALRGAGTDPYAVYQFESVEKERNGYLVKNRTAGVKRKAKSVSRVIEGRYIYPFIQGSDIETGFVSGYSHGLMVQDIVRRVAVKKSSLAKAAPKTLSYLSEFESNLKARKSKFVKQLMDVSEFYSMYGISKETLGNWKILWRRMGDTFKCTVVGTNKDPLTGKKKWVPTDTVAYIAVKNELEAMYVWAILSSVPFRWYLNCVSTPGRGYAPPNVVNQFHMKKFSRSNKKHVAIAKAAKAFIKSLIKANSKKDFNQLQTAYNALNQRIATLYGLSANVTQKMFTELPAQERKEVTFLLRSPRVETAQDKATSEKSSG